MNRKSHDFVLGADKPFTIIHISDTHLTFADNRNDERKIKLAERRKKGFPMRYPTSKKRKNSLMS